MDLYQIFINSSLCDFILNCKISAHLQKLFMDFPQFKVPNGGLHEERYSEKTNDNKDIFEICLTLEVTNDNFHGVHCLELNLRDFFFKSLHR